MWMEGILLYWTQKYLKLTAILIIVLIVSAFASEASKNFTITNCRSHDNLITLQYVAEHWSNFTFPGQNEPRPGHGTPWTDTGTIPAIPGRLASLQSWLFGAVSKLTWLIIQNYQLNLSCNNSFFFSKFGGPAKSAALFGRTPGTCSSDGSAYTWYKHRT